MACFELLIKWPVINSRDMCAGTSLIHDSNAMWLRESEAVGVKIESSKENLQRHQTIFVAWSYIIVIIIITVSSFRMTVLIKMCAMNFIRTTIANNETFFPLDMLKVP